VQAPQVVVSQPICVPVSPRVSRKMDQQGARFNLGLTLLVVDGNGDGHLHKLSPFR
jgi:hypothetical protein